MVNLTFFFKFKHLAFESIEEEKCFNLYVYCLNMWKGSSHNNSFDQDPGGIEIAKFPIGYKDLFIFCWFILQHFSFWKLN